MYIARYTTLIFCLTYRKRITMTEYRTIGIRDRTLERLKSLKFDFRVDSLDATIGALIEEHEKRGDLN